MSQAPVATDLEVQRVLFWLNPDEPVARRELWRLTGFSDRIIRAAIRRIDLEGLGAVVHEATGGYRLSTDPEEIRVMVERLESRIRHESERAAALRRKAREYEGEPQGALF